MGHFFRGKYCSDSACIRYMYMYYYYYYIDAPGHVGKYFCIKMRPRSAVHGGGVEMSEVFENLKVK
jgi:hypothetical protein